MLTDTMTKRLNKIKTEIIPELMRLFNCTEDRAWQMAAAGEAYRAWEVANEGKERQEKIAEAEAQSLAARAATYKTKIVNQSER